MSEKKYYVHVGFELNRTELLEKINAHIPEKFRNDIKQIISVATHYFTECQDNWLDAFYQKYKDQKITAYLKKLYVKETKKCLYLAATTVILGKWYYVCINNNDIPPYSLKKMVNSGQLGDGIDLENVSVECTTYRFLQDGQPYRYGRNYHWNR